MSTTFFAIWIAILVFDGVLMYSLTWAATSARYGKYRIRTPSSYQIPPARKFINTNLNNVLSLLIFIAYFIFWGEQTLRAGWPRLTTFLGETLGVLLLYDFMYYFFHRGLHHPKLMRYVHRVHHCVRFPVANESIYLHPAENIGGVGLLILSILMLGPVSSLSFLAIFFIHSVANIIVHSNLLIPHPAFRLFNFWVDKHDIHHNKVNYNFSSIFPFWDQAFGTSK